MRSVSVSIQLPQGYRFAGVHCGVKPNTTKRDVALVVCDRDAVAAGVYTQNLVCGAPVQLDRARTPAAGFRAVV
ncbi:MAG: bifunctional ornithine acetyltransferase/N-acetylglutamate synthase, partial [Thermoguttaceae bacterium]|nr:bifunctional ornithine acetyltransferase/N-acetylglutamate synthase [Thermoguttaceae bacterium]